MYFNMEVNKDIYIRSDQTIFVVYGSSGVVKFVITSVIKHYQYIHTGLIILNFNFMILVEH